MKDGITETPEEAFEFLTERVYDEKEYQSRSIKDSSVWFSHSKISSEEMKDAPIGVLFETQFRLPPAPKTVELEQADWADGPWWVKHQESDDWRLVVGVDMHGSILLSDENLRSSSFMRKNFLRSRTCRPDDWHKCEKEVK